MKSSTLTSFAPLSVTLVIPACNEIGNLTKLLADIEQTFLDQGYSLPVLVIDDGSTDGSIELLAKLKHQYSFLSVYHHAQRRGVTQVWRSAIAQVKTDWILWGQADLESDPRTDIPALLNAWRPGVDAIAGWRQQRGDGKVMASSVANKACRLTFGLNIHDMNWIKLVRRDQVAQLPLQVVTHRFLLAVLAGRGHRVVEVPTPWHPRHAGVSKFGRKRLVTSAGDFLKTLAWFYLAQPASEFAKGLKTTVAVPNPGSIEG